MSCQTIIAWADQSIRELPKHKGTISGIFIIFIHDLATYAKANNCRMEELFEVGCWWYNQIDQWFFYKKAQHRQHFFGSNIMNGFINLFQRHMGVANLGKIFDERVEHYTTLAQKKADPAQYIDCLVQLILKTRETGRIDHYNFELGKEPLVLGYFTTSEVKMNLMSFFNATFPASIKIIENTIV